MILTMNAQTKSNNLISCNYKNIRIDNFLDSLHHLKNYNFSYSPSFLPVDSLISVNLNQIELELVLKEIFKNQDPQIELNGSQVIIKPKYRDIKLKNVITLQGIVNDKSNLKPLPFVNISLFGKPIGTITNNEGYYKFLIPQTLKDSRIVFSSVGYETMEIKVPLTDSIVNIDLKPVSITLKEIKVRYLKADEIIENVCDNIENNYFTSPLLLSGFFRETIKQDGKYIEVSEAVLDIYKSSYLKYDDQEKVRFVKGRKTIDEKEVSIARLKLAGGPLLFSNIDLVKHLDFLPKDDKMIYNYSYIGKDIEFGRVVFKVAFKPYIESDEIYYNGEFHIDTESFAITSASFQLTKKTLRKSDQYLIRKDAKKIKSVPTFTQYHISYRPVGDKWILNSVRGEIKIRMLDKRQKKVKSFYHATADLLITNAVDGKNQKIKYAENYKSNYVLADQIINTEDEFWENYNIISPEEELLNVLKNKPVEIKIVPQLEKTRP